jgi:SecD/SecF fusion protein
VPERRRNGLILLLVIGLLAASLAVIALETTVLGLDLKGGVELVYQGRPSAAQPKVTQASLDRAIDIMRSRVDQLGVSEPEIQRSGRDQISVQLPGVGNVERAQRQVGTPAQLVFLDWEKDLLGPNNKPIAAGVTNGDTDAQRLSQGAGQPSVGQSLYDAVDQASKRKPIRDGNNFRLGKQFWLFEKKTHKYLAGPDDTLTDLRADARDRGATVAGNEVKTIQPGTLVLQAVKRDKGREPPANRPDLAKWYVLNDNPALLGKDVKNPEQNFNSGPGGGGGSPIVAFKFTDRGKRQFKQVTSDIAQRGQESLLPGTDPNTVAQHFAVALDRKLITVPTIDPKEFPEGIDGTNGAQIEGNFTITEAQDLANQLKLGALPIDLKLISQSRVSATLGQQALNQGLLAGAVGFGVVVLFLLAFYRVLGLIAALALVIYGVYFFALIKLIPITLTLPGIAGLILTIGVAADANIVIFERVKEEARSGSSIPASIARGYKKGLTAIIDANVVTLMTAFILFMLATAGVKGFAFTLGIGTIVSLFTAVLATQAILGTMSRTRVINSPGALGAGKRRQRQFFDFMGNSRIFFSMSGVILLIGAFAIAGKGINFGIDFESGTRIQAGFNQPASEDQVRSALQPLGYGDAKVQRLSGNDSELGPNAVQIRAKVQPDDVNRVRAALDRDFGLPEARFSSSSVGPTFGQTVANSALVALIASLLVISIYIAIRFEWKYAVPVLIGLMHDLLIVAGVYALAGREVTASTVAALLTILGFSLYDTIIVFDRVRENVPRMPTAAFSQIVNRSMHEVIVRSLATSLSTLLPVLALMLFGGETLKDFAFALLVGIASGAYSSIFIASPVLTHWKERERTFRQRRRRIVQEFGFVPAYADTGQDVEPERHERKSRSLFTPDQEQVSRDEFKEMTANLGLEDDRAARRARRAARIAARERGETPGRGTGTGTAPRPPAGNGGGDGAPPRTTGNGGGDGDGAPPRPKPKRPRNKRHGRPR